MPLTPLNFCVKVNKQNTFNYQLTNEAMGRGCLADYPLQGGNQDAKGGLIINLSYQILALGNVGDCLCQQVADGVGCSCRSDDCQRSGQ